MLVKPSIQWLNKDSDAQLINDLTAIIMAVDANVAIYATPAPPLASIQTELDTFIADVAAAVGGGLSTTSKKNNQRLIVTGLGRQLASYVQVACGGNMTKLLLSAFPVQKPERSPIGVLSVPSNPTLVLGKRSGELDAAVNPMFGASTYNWKLTSSVAGEAVRLAQTTASYVTFTGLTPGVTYTMTCYVVGAAGPSDPSKPASQMAV